MAVAAASAPLTGTAPLSVSFSSAGSYDPDGNDGLGTVTAVVGDQTSVCKLDKNHKKDKFYNFHI